MPSIKGKTVIVTGASAGVGEATAKLCVREGANVVLAARDGKALDALAAALGPRSRAVVTDVSKHADCEALMQGVARGLRPHRRTREQCRLQQPRHRRGRCARKHRAHHRGQPEGADPALQAGAAAPAGERWRSDRQRGIARRPRAAGPRGDLHGVQVRPARLLVRDGRGARGLGHYRVGRVARADRDGIHPERDRGRARHGVLAADGDGRRGGSRHRRVAARTASASA